MSCETRRRMRKGSVFPGSGEACNSLGKVRSPCDAGRLHGSSECLYPPCGFFNQPIGDGDERVVAACSFGKRAVEDGELTMGAGPAGEDFARVQHLVDATEMTRILIDQRQDLLE